MNFPRMEWTETRRHGLDTCFLVIKDAAGRVIFRTQQNTLRYAKTVAERWYNRHVKGPATAVAMNRNVKGKSV